MKPTPTPDLPNIAPVRERIERLVRDVQAGAIIGYDGPQEYWSTRMGAEASAEIARLLSAALSVPAAAVVGEQIEWLKARLADLQLPPGKRDHDTREKWLIQCGMPEAAPSAPEGWQPIDTAPKDAILTRLREAFDGDSIPKKNIALRKAFDEIEGLAEVVAAAEALIEAMPADTLLTADELGPLARLRSALGGKP